MQRRLTAQPINQRETIAVGKNKVQDQQIGRAKKAPVHRLLQRRGVVDPDSGVLEAPNDNLRELLVLFHQQNLARPFLDSEYAANFSQQEVLVEGLLHPTLSVAGKHRPFSRW